MQVIGMSSKAVVNRIFAYAMIYESILDIVVQRIIMSEIRLCMGSLLQKVPNNIFQQGASKLMHVILMNA